MLVFWPNVNIVTQNVSSLTKCSTKWPNPGGSNAPPCAPLRTPMTVGLGEYVQKFSNPKTCLNFFSLFMVGFRYFRYFSVFEYRCRYRFSDFQKYRDIGFPFRLSRCTPASVYNKERVKYCMYWNKWQQRVTAHRSSANRSNPRIETHLNSSCVLPCWHYSLYTVFQLFKPNWLFCI